MDKHEATEQFRKADDLFPAGLYTDALYLLDELDKDFPWTPRVLFARALSLAELGRFQEAVMLCDVLVKEMDYTKAQGLRERLLARMQTDAPPVETESEEVATAVSGIKRIRIRPIGYIQDGWDLVKDQYWLFFGICAVGMLIQAFTGPFLVIPMYCGIYGCCFKKVRGETVVFDDLFQGFKFFLPGCGLAILAQLMLAAVAIPIIILTIAMGFPEGSIGSIVFFSVSAFIALLMLITVMMFTCKLMVDRGLGVLEATGLSIRVVFTNAPAFIILTFVFFLLLDLGLVLLTVGAFFVLPILFASLVVAYGDVFPESRTRRPLGSPVLDVQQPLEAGETMSSGPGEDVSVPSPGPERTSKLAVASLVLGFLSFLYFQIFASIPAVILGHVARYRIRREPKALRGGSIAIAGLILGYVNVAIAVFVAALIGGIMALISSFGPEFQASSDSIVPPQFNEELDVPEFFREFTDTFGAVSSEEDVGAAPSRDEESVLIDRIQAYSDLFPSLTTSERDDTIDRIASYLHPDAYPSTGTRGLAAAIYRNWSGSTRLIEDEIEQLVLDPGGDSATAVLRLTKEISGLRESERFVERWEKLNGTWLYKVE